MAEFVEVMRKIRELCAERRECKECIMTMGAARICGVKLCEPRLSAEEIERRVAQWEAEKYPSWHDWQDKTFPSHSGERLCPKIFGVKCPRGTSTFTGNCNACRDLPIPTEIAEKLGIRPREVKR